MSELNNFILDQDLKDKLTEVLASMGIVEQDDEGELDVESITNFASHEIKMISTYYNTLLDDGEFETADDTVSFFMDILARQTIRLGAYREGWEIEMVPVYANDDDEEDIE